MKLLNKQIDMISWTSKDGTVTPVRFRMMEEDKAVVVKIDRILQVDQNMFGGSPSLLFRCSSVINGTERIYELSCNCAHQKWLLKKL